eukprot:6181145-Pleurochrysis_carterae.AAC.2
MPSRAPSFCFACTLAVFALAPLAYLALARSLRSEFPVDPVRMAVVAPCAHDRRPPAGAPTMGSKYGKLRFLCIYIYYKESIDDQNIVYRAGKRRSRSAYSAATARAPTR